MTELLLALGATGVSVAVMYVFCLRPMRRGHHAPHATADTDTTGAELARLRREVAALREHPKAQ